MDYKLQVNARRIIGAPPYEQSVMQKDKDRIIASSLIASSRRCYRCSFHRDHHTHITDLLRSS
jgi:hypothetical protein